MHTSESKSFYDSLLTHHISVSNLYAQEELFQVVPDDWYVVITDIENSTVAVESGKHQSVNLIATGSIVVALNIAKKYGISIPFFFGGDGATLIMPQMMVDEVMFALNLHKERTQLMQDLVLRIGSKSVAELRDLNEDLKLAKIRVNPYYTLPVVLGNALKRAENIIKSDSFVEPEFTPQNFNLNLEGMECKWDPINPPVNREEIVSLLVITRNKNDQAHVFQKLMKHIEHIYGEHAIRNPLSLSQLRFNPSLKKIKEEFEIKFSNLSWWRTAREWVQYNLGQYYLKFSKTGRKYKRELVLSAETLMLDGSINMVISGSATDRNHLVKILNEAERNNEIYYGLYVSEHSIMSCYVRGLDDYHVHFVDGSNGGYTNAAKILKSKLSKQVV